MLIVYCCVHESKKSNKSARKNKPSQKSRKMKICGYYAPELVV